MLKPVGPPPPRRHREYVRVRAELALSVMQRGEWVSDDVKYRTQSLAAGTVTRVRHDVSRFHNVESDCMVQRVRLVDGGWRWWLALRDRVEL